MPFEQYMIGNTRRVKYHKKRPGRFNVLANIKEESSTVIRNPSICMWCKIKIINIFIDHPCT